MGFLDIFRSKKASIPVLPPSITNVSNSFGTLFSKSNPAAQYKDWVYAAVSAIAEDVSKIDFILERKQSNGDVEVLTDHPAINILRNPNPFFSKTTIIRRLQSDLELWGDEYWYSELVNGVPTEIFPLRPEFITPIPDPMNFIKHYEYRLGDKKIIIPPENIIHYRNYNPKSDITGQSTLCSAQLAVDTDNYTKIYNKRFFQNQAIPGLVLKTPNAMTQESIEQLKKAWNQEFQGPNKAYRTAVLQNGLEVDRLQFKQADMEFMEQRKFSRDEILAIFRVPKTVIGVVEDVNFASAKAANFVFSQRTILPKMNQIADTLNLQYIPLFPDGENLEIKFKDPVAEDREALMAEYEKGLKNGWLSINDIRRREGLPEIQGGETVFQPFNVLPFGDPVKQKTIEKPATKLAKSIVNIFKEESFEQDQPVKNEPEFADSRVPSNFEELGENMKQRRDQRLDRDERAMARLMLKLWDEQRKEVIENLKKTIKKVAKQKVPNVFDEKANVKATIDLFTPLFTEIMISTGNSSFDFLGIDEEFTLTPTLQKFIVSNSKKFAGSVTKTTSKKIRSALATGLEQGEGIVELTKRVNTLAAFSSARAQKIALTEVLRASTRSELQVWKDTGVVEAKIWWTAQDERVCSICAPLHGKVVELNKTFFNLGDKFPDGTVVDYESVPGPPSHPQCRCTTIPVIKEGKSYVPPTQKITDEELYHHLVDGQKTTQ